MLLDRAAGLMDRLDLPRVALAIRVRGYALRGEPEAGLLRWLAPPGKVAIDVGAADGVYSQLLRSLGAKVVAFEPNPGSYARLRRAMPDVDLRNAALSDREGRTTLRVPVVGRLALTGWGSISARNDFPELAVGALVEHDVPATTIDALGLGEVGFVKVDVEGHELEVLRGARGVLERWRPNLLVELGDERRGSQPALVVGLLRELGYELLALDAHGTLRRFDGDLGGRGSANLVAIRPSRW